MRTAAGNRHIEVAAVEGLMVRRATRLLARGTMLLLLLCSASLVCGSDQLEVPLILPDGSELIDVRDVFAEVADEATAQQLRAHMPHVTGGTEYRYVLEDNGQVKAEWGIVVFDFADEQTALSAFQYLANEVATVNKNPRVIRIEGAEDVPEIQEFLASDLEYACLMNEIVIFANERFIVWIDDYELSVAADGDNVWDENIRASLLKATQIADLVHSLSKTEDNNHRIEMIGVKGEEKKPDGPLTVKFSNKWWSHTAVFTIENPGSHYVYIPAPDGNLEWFGITLDPGRTWQSKIESADPLEWSAVTAKDLYGELADSIVVIKVLVNPPEGPAEFVKLVAPVLVEKATGIDAISLLLEGLIYFLSHDREAAEEHFKKCFLFPVSEYETTRNDTPGCRLEYTEPSIPEAIYHYRCRCCRRLPHSMCHSVNQYAAAHLELDAYQYEEYKELYDLPKDESIPYFILPAKTSLVIKIPYTTIDEDKIKFVIHDYQALDPLVVWPGEESRNMVLTICATYFKPGLQASYETPPFNHYSEHYELEPQPKASDLTASSVSWEPSNPKIGDKVIFSYSIENQGKGKAGTSHSALFIDGTRISEQQVGPLDASTSTTGTFPKTWEATPGTHKIMVQVDCNDQVTETNESNNVLSRVLQVESPQPELPPTATVLVMDVSNSMGEPWKGGIKIESAKQAALDFIEHVAQEGQALGTDHRIAVVGFSDEAHVLLPLTNDYARARNIIIDLRPDAWTNIGDGLVKGLQQLANLEDDAQRFVILLSDGESNRGLSDDRILSEPVANARNNGICIHTVGFGDPGDLNVQLLRQIASRSGCGDYMYAESPDVIHFRYIRARHTALGEIAAEFSSEIRDVAWIPGVPSALGVILLTGTERELHITLAWTEEGKLRVQLRDPTGSVVDEQAPGVVSYAGERFSYMMVPSPEPGVWTVEAVPTVGAPEASKFFAVASTRPGGGALAFPLPIFDFGDYSFTLPAGLPGWLLILASIAFFIFQLYEKNR